MAFSGRLCTLPGGGLAVFAPQANFFLLPRDHDINLMRCRLQKSLGATRLPGPPHLVDGSPRHPPRPGRRQISPFRPLDALTKSHSLIRKRPQLETPPARGHATKCPVSPGAPCLVPALEPGSFFWFFFWEGAFTIGRESTAPVFLRALSPGGPPPTGAARTCEPEAPSAPRCVPVAVRVRVY